MGAQKNGADDTGDDTGDKDDGNDDDDGGGKDARVGDDGEEATAAATEVVKCACRFDASTPAQLSSSTRHADESPGETVPPVPSCASLTNQSASSRSERPTVSWY
jgi:hypothetical protein